MNNRRIFWLSYITIVCLFLLRLIPFIFRDARLWGFNHLIFLPAGYTVAFAALSIMALILPFLKIARPLGQSLEDHFSRLFFESRRKYLHRLLFVVATGILFILFVMPTHFLGDGYTLISNLASAKGIFYKWSEKGITFILNSIQSLLGPKNNTTAIASYRIVSILSGIVTIWFFFLISELVANDRRQRFLAFSTLFLSGGLLLFFGYTENYPALWIFLSGFTYFGLRYLSGSPGLTWSLMFLLFGLLIHVMAGLLIPAWLFILFSRGRARLLYEKYRTLFWGVTGLLAMAGIMLLIYRYTTNLYVEDIFLPLFGGKTAAPESAIISVPHFSDIINLLLLLSPLLPLLMLLSSLEFRSIFKEKAAVFLGLSSTSILLFLFVIDGKLGMLRDWDLFSLSAVAPTLLCVALIRKTHFDELRSLSLSLTLYLLVAVLPFLVTNLNREASVRYAKYAINLDKNKSMSALITMRNYFEELGQKRIADSLNSLYPVYYAEAAKITYAYKALDANNVEVGAAIVKMIKPDKFSHMYHDLMCLLHTKLGDFTRAIDESDKALQLSPYAASYLCNRAWIYNEMGDYRRSQEYLMKAYRYNNADAGTLEGISANYVALGLLDSAAFFASRLITLDTVYGNGHFLMAQIYLKKNMLDSAETHARLFVKHASRDSITTQRAASLIQRIEQLRINR